MRKVDYDSRNLDIGTIYLLEKAGYKAEVIKEMSRREAIISLTVAVMRGIAQDELNAIEVIDVAMNSSHDFSEWNQVDLESARSVLLAIGGTANEASKNIKYMASLTQAKMPSLPEEPLENQVTVVDILSAYAATNPPQLSRLQRIKSSLIN